MHGGPAWPAAVAWSGILAMALALGLVLNFTRSREEQKGKKHAQWKQAAGAAKGAG
jgi:hypothetical protein